MEVGYFRYALYCRCQEDDLEDLKDWPPFVARKLNVFSSLIHQVMWACTGLIVIISQKSATLSMAVVKMETSRIGSTQCICLDCWIYASYDASQNLHHSESQSTILLQKCREYMPVCGGR